MIKDLLIWVVDTKNLQPAVRWTLDLARALTARVYAVYILPEGTAKRKGNRQSGSEPEEKAWELLYEVEDEAFEQNVRISLLMENGDPLTRLCELINIYKVDLVVASADCPLPAEELIRHSPRPVVFVRNYKEE